VKTGTEVLKLPDGTYAVDLLNGSYGIFRKKKHAEQFIFQQNARFIWARDDRNARELDEAIAEIEAGNVTEFRP
jgi:hypothetical protein